MAGKDLQNTKATALDNWYKDSYESVIVQRNLLLIFSFVALVVILGAVFAIRYIKSTQSIEPFVIEIDRKTGKPIVVNSLDIAEYSNNELVKRSLVVSYIKAREEYFFQTYQRNYYDVVRVFSASNVYYSEYRPKFSISNPSSPYNLYGKASVRVVNLKSMIFTSPNTAQIRITTEVQGSQSGRADRIILMAFEFQKLNLSEQDAMINPLGFVVTMYRIEDENLG